MIATSKDIRFTVEEYFRMSDAGVFSGRRVELIRGRIRQMHAQANPHRAAMTRGAIVLGRHFGDVATYWVVVQGTLLVPPSSAPDPDFHIFDVPVGTPDEKLPVPFLIIEVADSSYRRDSGLKLKLYASMGVGDYWIENLNEDRIEVYRDPFNRTGIWQDWEYRSVTHYARGQSVPLLKFPQVSLGVSELLP
jgi:Uma2 family endonuclease